MLSRRFPGDGSRQRPGPCATHSRGETRCAGRRSARLARLQVGFLACADGFCFFCHFRVFSLAYGFASSAPFLRVAGCDWGRGSLVEESREDLAVRAGVRLQDLGTPVPRPARPWVALRVILPTFAPRACAPSWDVSAPFVVTSPRGCFTPLAPTGHLPCPCGAVTLTPPSVPRGLLSAPSPGLPRAPAGSAPVRRGPCAREWRWPCSRRRQDPARQPALPDLPQPGAASWPVAFGCGVQRGLSARRE